MAKIKCKLNTLNSYTVSIQKENGEFKSLTEVPFKVMVYLKKHCSKMSRADVRKFVTRHRKSLIERLKMQECY